VLLVEDEEQILDTGKIILERHGYSVLTANHPEDGVRLFAENAAEISLLITDVIMPGMNGRELWERLAARKPDLKCLFVSAYPAEVITDRGLLEPGRHFIEKPFSLNEFTEKVREVLDRKP
jgi:DNA-binding response OmpR family regulator